MINRLYECPLPMIAITGGIATGKSTVSDLLRQQGQVIICADGLVKEIYQQEETVDFVSRLSYAAVKEGKIDFAFLRQLFFNDRSIQLQLENYIYSHLPLAFNQKMQEQRPEHYLFYDVPLLFEKSLDERVDLSICVYCPRDIQKKRLLSRDGNTEELVEKILSSQLDIEVKRQRASLVVDNSGTLEQLEEQVPKLIRTIREKFLVLQ